MKTSKRFLALVLSALMIFSVVIIPGADLSIFGVEADAADISLGGITQQRVVSNYEATYDKYRSKFFGNRNTNWPTNFVIPGLSSANDYTPQGMTYWKAKEWILISAYDASGAGKNSVVYAIDAVTTDFVALFRIFNANGTVNTSHGGGIAASEYNFYYADKGSNISYFPISEMDVPVGTVKDIKLVDSINCSGEMNTAYTSYCCYDDGVLWTGNFYLKNDDYDYNQPANASYNSMLLGYKLHGNSSAEEWYYLSKNFNLVNITTASGTGTSSGSNITWTATNYNGANAEIRGSITYGGTYVGEFCPTFANAELKEGTKYKIEFISSNNQTDIYLFATNAGNKHTNVKQSSQTTITNLSDGRYHYEMIFTAGLKPAGADSSWPTTQSTDGSFSGTYNIRFDQDAISSNRDFVITDLSISEYAETEGFTPDATYEGIGCEGNPTYAIAIDNTYDKIQYAMVDKGKIYMSRSWSRNMSGSTHVRALAIADIDINAPGTEPLTVNGRSRKCHLVKSSDVTQFGIDKNKSFTNKDILAMGEALCIMNDYLYMFGESAAWNYNGKESDNKCSEPVDVIWKIDQYAIMNEKRPAEEVSSVYYKKVTNLDDITSSDEYIIVFESEEKDPVTQKNILYAFDAFGGYNDSKLPKQNNYSNTGDNMGMIGYTINSYSTGTITEKVNNKDVTYDVIYLNETDDEQKSIRWNLTLNSAKNGIQIQNRDFYYNKNAYLNFNERAFIMSTSSTGVGILPADNPGDFYLFATVDNKPSYLWCNDGTIDGGIEAYTEYYWKNTENGYSPVYNGAEEIKGTIHTDALRNFGDDGGNIYKSIPDYSYGCFNIYKKAADPYSTTTGTRVFTDMNAELQSDGTYTVRLETYATSSISYRTVEQKRPTDFILVLDNSTSMSTQDYNGFHRHNSFDLEAAAGTQDAAGNSTNDLKNKKVIGTYTGNMWIQHTDGTMCPVSVKVVGDGSHWEVGMWSTDYYLRAYLWYTHPNTGTKYWYHINTNSWTTTETSYDEAQRIGADNKADRYNTNVFSGVCYEKRSNSSRLSNMQIAANQLIWKIEENAQDYDLDHRISLIQFSDDTNSKMYMIDPSTNATSTYTYNTGTANYKNAFFSRSQFSIMKNLVNSLTAVGGKTDAAYGMTMASNIINSNASGQDYTMTGNRSACIIFVSDGLVTAQEGKELDNTSSIARQAVEAAHKAKENGAYIYTARLGTFTSGHYDVAALFENSSSNYPDAMNMFESGDKNTIDVDFTIDVDVSDVNKLNDFANNLYSSIDSNSNNALAKMGKESIVCGQIEDIFYTTEVDINKNIKVYTADSQADGLGRISFKTPVETTGVTVDKTKFENDSTVRVSGFDYSENYVSPSHQGKKLIIEISGLLANPNYDFNNANITVHDNTALYQNSTYLTNEDPIKHYPQENFTIPEYTYVLDYGIGMLDTDVNGTLKSISRQPTAQRDSEGKIEYVGHLIADNVSMNVTNNWYDLVYGLKPSISDADFNSGYDHSSGYCLIQRDDGTYDWFKINIKPASNVYFEEFIETNISSSDKGYSGWNTAGEKRTDLYQTLTGEDSVYGYDSNYLGDTSTYSYGSAYTSQVSADTMRSETISFDYTGTAVDIVASCGVDTGIYIVTIKNNGVAEKAYIVDTYFTDSSVLNGVTQLNQVPIVHHENANGYGTYTAEVTSVYLSSIVGGRTTFAMDRFGNDDVSFYSRDITEEAKEAILQFADMEYLLDTDVEVVFCDENSVLNGGTGVEGASGGMATFGLRGATATATKPLTNYFDGYRIYKPLGDNETDYVQTEQGSEYYNVIDSLVSTDDIIEGSGTGFIGYVVGNGNGEADFANYAKNGPSNEVYLSNGNAIAFTAPEGYERVMVSLRAVNGSPKAKIGDKEFAITSSTEMYYDITDYIQDGTIAIQNSGSGLLAVNNIKLVSGHAIQPFMMFNMSRIRMMMAAPAEEVEPNLPAETPNEGGSWPTDIPYTEPFPTPEEPSTTPDGDTGAEEEKGFIEQITESFTKLLNMIKSMLDTIVNLLKSIMA